MSEMQEIAYTEQPEEFTVTDDATAQWCMKKIREAEETKEMWRKHYDEQFAKVTAASDASIAYMTAKLEEYFLTVPHKATKTQESYALPGGKLLRKKQQPKFDTDDEALVAWLKSSDMKQFVKVKESADWASLKKLVAMSADGEHVMMADGEIVPGVTVTIRPDIFKVEMEG